MSFWSFLTSHDPYRHFRCFYAIFNLCLLISDLSLHQWTIYAFPILLYTYLMCFRPCPTFSSLYLSLHLLMFRCFGYFWLLIGFTDCNVTIPSDSNPYGLLVISEPSDTILTPPMLPLLIPYLPFPFKKEKYFALCSQDLIRLCIISIWLKLCSPVFLDLIPHTSTSKHRIIPCSTVFSWLFFIFTLCFISFAPISLDLLLPTLDYVYKPPHSLTYHYPITIEPVWIQFTVLQQSTTG